MNQQKLLLDTFKASFIIQIITGIVTFLGLFIKLKPQDNILKDVLRIENYVQIVEAIFYIYIIFAYNNLHKNDITSRRYFDWIITTPIMLITTVLFMIYKNRKDKNQILKTKQLLKDNKSILIRIVAFNFLMLLFGYLGEKNIMNKVISTILGFVFFYLSFYEIWKNYAKKTKENKKLFYTIFTIWALYGVASVFPLVPKNIMYNFLDIIAKNFYGLYMFYIVFQKRIK